MAAIDSESDRNFSAPNARACKLQKFVAARKPEYCLLEFFLFVALSVLLILQSSLVALRLPVRARQLFPSPALSSPERLFFHPRILPPRQHLVQSQEFP